MYKSALKFLENFIEIKENKLVKEIMSKNLSTLDKEKTPLDAMKLMSKNHFSSIIIKKGRKPIGIVTEKDIISRVFLKNKDPEKIKLKSIMTTKLETISPEITIIEASYIMKEKKIKKLIVVNKNGNLVGLLTQTDIVGNLKQIYSRYNKILWDPLFYLIVLIIISLVFFFRSGNCG
ncbi:CBS domain-containing protein [Candidatus Woesearchaeota archaeon]|nr:CBS domain-containing protein [Candidatus Woesearchaeota archaeon]